jgi:hypothetical protein
MRVVSIDAMVRADTRGRDRDRPAGSGQWLSQAQAVCATVSASDAGSGVADAEVSLTYLARRETIATKVGVQTPRGSGK